MRNNNLANRGLAALLGGGNDDGDQLSLPFDLPEPNREPQLITTRHLLDLKDRRARRYEVTVHQDPHNLMVLSYCLRPVTLH